MITGVWTSTEFRANTKSSSIFGRRKPLLIAIELVLDEVHAMPEENALMSLFHIEQACKKWLEAHPYTTSTKESGKKFSNRRKGIEMLLAQCKKKREELYKIPDSEWQRRKAITDLYETSTKDLKIAPSPSGYLDPRTMKGRAGFHQELLEKTIERAKALGHKKEDFNTEQIGFLTAKSILKVDAVVDKKNKNLCKTEAMRVLLAMLGKNRTLAQQFEATGVEVVVVPANRPMTDLPEFSSLKGVAISQDSGTARTWDETRGVGGLTVNDNGKTKVYVAITEENLLGTGVSTEVSAVGGGCYEKKYSTSSHEFAHGIHLSSALDATQKNTIKTCFDKKKRARIVASHNCIDVLDATFAPSQTTLDALFNEEWVDGPRKKLAPLTAAKTWYVSKNGAWVMRPGAPTQRLTFTTTNDLQDCYAAFDNREYFAQCVNAYLGANGGTDPYTGRPRHNGESWIRTNCEADMVRLLDTLFSAGTTHGYAHSDLQNTNVQEDTGDELTVIDYLRLEKNQKVLTEALTSRRAAMGYDDED